MKKVKHETFEELCEFIANQEEKLINTLYGSKTMLLTFYGMREFATVEGIKEQYSKNDKKVSYYDFTGIVTLERMEA